MKNFQVALLIAGLAAAGAAPVKDISNTVEVTNQVSQEDLNDFLLSVVDTVDNSMPDIEVGLLIKFGQLREQIIKTMQDFLLVSRETLVKTKGKKTSDAVIILKDYLLEHMPQFTKHSKADVDGVVKTINDSIEIFRKAINKKGPSKS